MYGKPKFGVVEEGEYRFRMVRDLAAQPKLGLS